MLKKSASFVLASFSSSTYGHGKEACLGRLGVDGKNDVASPPGHGRLTDSPACTDVALFINRAVHLAAALLDGLFEHPADWSESISEFQ